MRLHPEAPTPRRAKSLLLLAAAALAGACAATPPPRGGQEKIVICHKGKSTLTIAEPAWAAHRRHGDTLGACR